MPAPPAEDTANSDLTSRSVSLILRQVRVQVQIPLRNRAQQVPVRFESHPDVAKALPNWQGKTIIDVTNAYGVPG